MKVAESRTCHCEPKVTERSRSGGAAIQGSLLLVVLLALFLAISATAADAVPNKCDSLRVSTLNMSEEEIAEICGIDSTKLAQGPTLQELNEEDPKYIKRDYDHKQQVVVGSVIMLCVAVAMVLMNNYNPKR